ncbi:cobalt transporter CbiM [Desulfogranum marinum]|jgi:cobalt/nickel transport system permease protein|uniref:cobalt transporter CbiM n=1 Tax=Desulfogranum marinum TaxID=453220 RepID=UPI00196457C8|nr:cobalt transporter CbiM [Desulfogranum marinum]MBM9514384.1 cobalt transporter CbiM [Desulfogranum marinum]
MHIADGVLPTSIIFTTYALSSAGIAYSLRKINPEDLPKIAVVTASFFVASLIHLPLGPTSVHLLLPGLMGVLLGPAAAFLSVVVGLVLQSILFQFGGLTALGANSLMIGVPAFLCGLLFLRFQGSTLRSNVAGAAIAGGLGTVLAALILAGLLYTSGESFFRVAQLALVAHIPVALIEAVVSAATVSFIFRVKPEMLYWSRTLLYTNDAAR